MEVLLSFWDHLKTSSNSRNIKLSWGRISKKITLYLCSSSDLELSKEQRNKTVPYESSDHCCEEESSHHVYEDGHMDITTEEMQQIENDMQMAQVTQNKWENDNLNEINPKSTI